MSGYPRVQPVRPVHVTAPLCLLCSSSLPSATSSTSVSGKPSSSSDAVMTNCCRRAICAPCVARSPRTARWDPCLACEGGWKGKARGSHAGPAHGTQPDRESDFVLGDEDEDDQDAGSGVGEDKSDHAAFGQEPSTSAHPEPLADGSPSPPSALVRHIVQKSDTLIGIALKYGLDVS